MDLLEHLAAQFPTAKRTTLRRMIEAGRVTINGLPARRAKDPVAEGDTVAVADQSPDAAEPAPVARPPFEIVHEDDDVIVILKPPGLLTSTNARERRATVASKLEEYFASTAPRARVGVIHRLDRDASGLLVFSKNNSAYHNLKTQFFHHTVERVYTAVLGGVVQPAEGRIESLLMEREDGRVMETDEPSDGQEAVTTYRTLATARPDLGLAAGRKTVTLVRVTLETGRKHQIRAHFAAKGCPVLGDPVYGPFPEPGMRLMLAATELAFDHPRTKERKSFRIKPPKEINALFPGVPTDA
ncbi:MAG TPA: RluA family pseudouridine synthase [Tepidisphaeraceae bacterium]|nr:RluA family pseudouridine synthase [Tepidisphaeraceae bacterium]